MSDANPTFQLPPCPLCSHRGAVERPVWKFAANVSERQGRKCYFFLGCKHAAETANPRVIYYEASDWAGVEKDWLARTERMFALRTAAWGEAQRERFRRDIAGAAFIPGAVAPLNFSP